MPYPPDIDPDEPEPLNEIIILWLEKLLPEDRADFMAELESVFCSQCGYHHPEPDRRSGEPVRCSCWEADR